MFGLKTIKGEIVITILIVVCVIAGVGTYWITKKPDTPIEEAAEAVFKMQTGVDVDFSPDSPEN